MKETLGKRERGTRKTCFGEGGVYIGANCFPVLSISIGTWLLSLTLLLGRLGMHAALKVKRGTNFSFPMTIEILLAGARGGDICWEIVKWKWKVCPFHHNAHSAYKLFRHDFGDFCYVKTSS